MVFFADDEEFTDDEDLLLENEDFDLEEDDDDTDTTEENEEEVVDDLDLEEEVEAPQEVVEEEAYTPEPQQSSFSGAVTPGAIPINIQVEVGRLEMSAQKVLDLSPGNLLDLNVRPEDAVSLMVNGKCVGTGELVHMGETIGVRVISLG
jgi:flagellar motor switch protein FliN